MVYGTKGMVACSQPLAAEAGLEILRKGGNAADAAVAVAAALNLTEPSSAGLGGDGFCLFYNARTKEAKGLNGSGRSPEKLSIDHVRQRGIAGPRIPWQDINAVTVPGYAALWVDTVETFGTFNISDVLQPAIQLAEDGVPVSELNSFFLATIGGGHQKGLTRWKRNASQRTCPTPGRTNDLSRSRTNVP